MLWVGTYQAKGGRGLYPLDCTAGRLEVGEPDPRIANASFAAWCPRTHTAYFVDEREDGRVSAWHWREGIWHPRGGQATGGKLPCYLALDPGRRFVAVANYGDGSVALIARDLATGELGERVSLQQATGRGPNRERQDGPHAHCALFSEDGRTLFHADLGLDQVFAYSVNDTGFGEAEVAFTAPPGSGPRHLLLHPDGRHALLLCELSAELVLLERVDRRLEPRQTLKSAPPEAPPDNLGGHLGLAPNGDILVTNRGHDSLARFVLVDNRLECRGWLPTGGASPRHFHAGASGTLIAHEESGTLTLIHGAERTTTDLPGAAFVLSVT